MLVLDDIDAGLLERLLEVIVLLQLRQFALFLCQLLAARLLGLLTPRCALDVDRRPVEWQSRR